ncbi:MAG: peptidoglycan editing factor PgeF [Acidobacteriota bacterium]|nr:peptidoglycan editing factor PgeF [Acidobacteriota bacterium]
MSIPIETITTENLTDQSLAEKGFYWREKDGVRVLICAALEREGFINGFSTRIGGTSPFPEKDLNLAGFDDDLAENIYENRRRFLKAFEGEWKIASCWQVHGDKIRFVKDFADADDGNHKMDALISDARRILLGVKTADCVPVLLGDVKTRAFAAIHAGWRGTVASIVPKTINEMREKFGTDPQNLIAAIGPAASGRNYEVGSDVIETFQQNFSENYQDFFTPTRENHALVDLFKANRFQLLSNGVAPENIYISELCTMERTDLFFSYRVEKRLYGKTGRLLSVIGRQN